MKKLVNLGNLGLSDREILQVQVLFSLYISLLFYFSDELYLTVRLLSLAIYSVCLKPNILVVKYNHGCLF